MEGLKRKLLEFVELSIGILKSKLEKKLIQPHKMTQHLPKVDLIDTETHTQIKTSFERIEIDIWTIAIHDLVKNVIMNKELYSQIKEIIIQNYNVVIRKFFPGAKIDSQLDFILSQYLIKILNRTISKEYDLNLIKQEIEIFLCELKGEDIEYHSIFYITHLYTDSNEIEIIPGVILRHPKISDFVEPITQQVITIQNPNIIVPKLILETKMKFKDESEARDFGFRIIQCLRLYSKNVAYCSYMKVQRISIMYPVSSMQNYIARIPQIKQYIISTKQEPHFVEFIKIILKYLGNLSQNDKHQRINHAFLKHGESLLQDDQYIKKLSNAVIGLEALYKFETERSKITKKLCERIATTFSTNEKEFSIIEEKMRRAYFFRSQDLHGNIIRKEWLKEIEKLYQNIIEILRLSVILFLYSSDKQTPLEIMLDSQCDKNQELSELKGKASKELEIDFSSNNVFN